MLNLTQHKATAEQVAAGVVDLPEEDRNELTMLLTFNLIPTEKEIRLVAELVASIAKRCHDGSNAAMIGGAPWLMRPLAAELKGDGILPVFAFSVRESEDITQPDGSIRKVSVFRHKGFVPA